jgi:hypothetical protein
MVGKSFSESLFDDGLEIRFILFENVLKYKLCSLQAPGQGTGVDCSWQWDPLIRHKLRPELAQFLYLFPSFFIQSGICPDNLPVSV